YKGGTMRLGAQPCRLDEGSLAAACYGKLDISERHRHRYEFNPEYRRQLAEAGLIATGINPQSGLVEVIEIPEHPWFLAVQFHPEFKSKPAAAHPLFQGFVEAAIARHHERVQMPV
ncbi:MAG: gamma-glutamyl-gamma-aminobutyrate hydrolase family protein, partial [Pirellulaceae bacterium]